MTERYDRRETILAALSESSNKGISVAAAYESTDLARVEVEQAAREVMLTYLREEVDFVSSANVGFGKEPYGVMGKSYIKVVLDREKYLAAVIRLQQSKLALQIPKDRIFVVTHPTDSALEQWKTKIETSFGGGRLSAEELMRRYCVIAVNPNSDGFRDDFTNQVVIMNEAFFKQ